MTGASVPDFRPVFERAGFHVRGSRASCPYCAGRRTLTVAIRGALFFCHRCQRGGSIRKLARERGITLPPPRVRLADKPKAAFRAWLSAKMSEMADEERTLARRAEWAKACLHLYPDHEGAWEALKRWYDAQWKFEIFWQSAGDKIGRHDLYREWRRSTKPKKGDSSAMSYDPP